MHIDHYSVLRGAIQTANMQPQHTDTNTSALQAIKLLFSVFSDFGWK